MFDKRKQIQLFLRESEKSLSKPVKSNVFALVISVEVEAYQRIKLAGSVCI
jgi:hypothetical protein